MFEKLKAFYGVFRAGQSVADPAAWKRGQITASMIAAVIGALLTVGRIYGISLSITDDQLVQMGGVVLAVYGLLNGGVTVASTDKIGLPAGPVQPGADPGAGAPVLPAVAEAVSPTVPPVRRAGNGDVLDGLDTTHAF